MAGISQKPPLALIRANKGQVDLYQWRGNWYARKWPVTPKSHITQATMATAAIFGALSKNFAYYPPELRQAALDLSSGLPWTAKDAFTYLSMKGGAAFAFNPFGGIMVDTIPPFAITAFEVNQFPAFFQTRIRLTAIPNIQVHALRLPEPLSRRTTTVTRRGLACQTNPLWTGTPDQRRIGVPVVAGGPDYSIMLQEFGPAHLVTYAIQFRLVGLPTQFLLRTQGPVVTVLTNQNWP